VRRSPYPLCHDSVRAGFNRPTIPETEDDTRRERRIRSIGRYGMYTSRSLPYALKPRIKPTSVCEVPFRLIDFPTLSGLSSEPGFPETTAENLPPAPPPPDRRSSRKWRDRRTSRLAFQKIGRNP